MVVSKDWEADRNSHCLNISEEASLLLTLPSHDLCLCGVMDVHCNYELMKTNLGKMFGDELFCNKFCIEYIHQISSLYHLSMKNKGDNL